MFYGKPRKNALLSFMLGAFCIILGGVPLLNLKFATTIPQLFQPTILKIALLLGGLLLLYDGLQLKNPMTGLPSYMAMLAGIVLAALGAIPLLIDLGVVNKYLPFIATLNISPAVLQGLLVFFGLYLLYDAYMLSKQFF